MIVTDDYNNVGIILMIDYHDDVVLVERLDRHSTLWYDPHDLEKPQNSKERF